MTFTTDRNDFIRQMRGEFDNHSNFEEITNSPTPAQIRRLFQYLRGRYEDIKNAFQSYASIFYIHRGLTNNPGTVEYPGGPGGLACDSWSEVLWTRREGGRNVIDCDGFAVMGMELLKEAGCHFVEYRYAFPADEWEPRNSHIIAVMSLNSNIIFISNNKIYNSYIRALMDIGWDPRTTRYSSGQTVREAWVEGWQMIENIQVYRVMSEMTPARIFRKLSRHF